jgi:hypothetical protein
MQATAGEFFAVDLREHGGTHMRVASASVVRRTEGQFDDSARPPDVPGTRIMVNHQRAGAQWPAPKQKTAGDDGRDGHREAATRTPDPRLRARARSAVELQLGQGPAMRALRAAPSAGLTFRRHCQSHRTDSGTSSNYHAERAGDPDASAELHVVSVYEGRLADDASRL